MQMLKSVNVFFFRIPCPCRNNLYRYTNVKTRVALDQDAIAHIDQIKKTTHPASGQDVDTR